MTLDMAYTTYTEDSGVLYEKSSDNLRVESLRLELKQILESYRNPEGQEAKGIVDPKHTRLTLQGTMECLECIRSMIMAFSGDRHDSGSYVDFLARMTPRNEETESSIIMP